MNIHIFLYSSSIIIYRRAKHNLIIWFSVLRVEVRCSCVYFQVFKKEYMVYIYGLDMYWKIIT